MNKTILSIICCMSMMKGFALNAGDTELQHKFPCALHNPSSVTDIDYTALDPKDIFEMLSPEIKASIERELDGISRDGIWISGGDYDNAFDSIDAYDVERQKVYRKVFPDDKRAKVLPQVDAIFRALSLPVHLYSWWRNPENEISYDVWIERKRTKS